MQASILKVNELGEDSIAVPIIGTGHLCFPPREAGRIMLDEAVTVCQNNRERCLICFVSRRSGTHRCFYARGNQLAK